MTAIRTLMSGLIDYAGLFPPANLDMKAAVENYAAYRAGGNAWALGRFIVPAVRLAEFEQACSPLQVSGWKLSVLVSGDVADDVSRIEEFRARGETAIVDAIECKAIEFVSLPENVITCFEVPLVPGFEDSIALLAKHGGRAKVRAGGVTAAAFPSANQVVDFLRCCAKLRVPFKATAGLHHPLRSRHPFTYEVDSASGEMHGFLNVFLAASLAYFEAAPAAILAILEELSPAAFTFDRESVRWREHRITAEKLAEVRQQFAISFGSCSFTEPIAELKTLGWL